MNFWILAIFFAFLCGCCLETPRYDLDSVAHYSSKHSKEEGWIIESMESFRIGGYEGPFFEVAYFAEKDLGIIKMRNMLVHHVLQYLQDNKHNQKLIKSIHSKDNSLSYRNVSIDLTFYEKQNDKSKGPLAFVTYRNEHVRYWIYNPELSQYEIVHVELIHDALKLSPVCIDKTLVQTENSSSFEFL